METLLDIKNLNVDFTENGVVTEAVRDVSFSLRKGEVLALVGESGSGKSVLCRTIIGLLGPNGHIRSGTIDGPEKSRVSMIFQDPMTSLDPAMPIGKQIEEAIPRSEKRRGAASRWKGTDAGQREADARLNEADARQSETDARLNEADARQSEADARQSETDARQSEAGAGRNEADARRRGAASRKRAEALLSLVGIEDAAVRYGQYPSYFSGGMRQRIAVAIALAMNPLILLADEPTTSLDAAVQAQIMELLAGIKAKTDTSVLFVTHDLSLVKNYADRVLIMRDGRIVESGDTAHIFSAPAGDYTKKLILFSGYGDGSAHTHGNIHFHEGVPHSHGTPGGNDAPLLSMKRVSKYYEMGRRKTLRVLDDINIDIYEGEIVGLCGRSGIGKSTLARCLIGLEGVSAGEIHYGMSLKAKNAMQMIFQDSKSAMNPRMTVAEIIGEPLRLERGKRPPEEEIARLMEDVELDESLLHRYPHEISGGQRQRVAIARAISTKPAFLIADEPMSSLDVTIRAQIVHLLKKIKEDRALTMLLISHDLPMLLHISDRIYDLP